ncbi:Mur ligase family protein [Candidatus Saccharibacteria bacterium]|nr:Mur ligase family protein [Candidatus Saccharibacteria bacterium]NCU40328.1 Mur ligase family protein [Candidatus Saccharibacteria bacterium]
MFLINTVIGKIIAHTLRLFGRGGGTLPGLIIERIHPNFLPKAIARLPYGAVIVTGTNGKTTTTKVLATLLRSHDLRVLTNETGSNFVRGTIAAVLNHIRWTGSLPFDIAIFELDEAYARRFAKIVRPTGVVGLNILRDQMDRFGEIDTTAAYVRETCLAATKWLVLNANDPRIARVADEAIVPIRWFGHVESLATVYASDDQHHSHDSINYFQANEAQDVLESYTENHVKIRSDGISADYIVQLAGSHNAINITAALAALHCVIEEVNYDIVMQTLKRLLPAFGRGEELILPSGLILRLQLVKNPNGFTHALRTAQDDNYRLVAIAINDDYADGRDVSWLWDVGFHCLQGRTVLCSGTRSTDMAVRLRYDEVETTADIEDFNALIVRLMSEQTDKAIVYCTYTAMLRIRKLLHHQGVAMEHVDL